MRFLFFVGSVDGFDESFLERPQLEQRSGQRSRTARKRFHEFYDALCARETWRGPWMLFLKYEARFVFAPMRFGFLMRLAPVHAVPCLFARGLLTLANRF